MIYNPEKHHRRSIRLRDYDYSQSGAYFVTICSWSRECLFGDVVNGEMRLNESGEMVIRTWEDLPNHYGNVTLDEFIIMPNHVHGIVILFSGDVGAGLKPAHSDADMDSNRAGLKPAPTKQHGLSEIVRAFKTYSARRINEIRNTPSLPVWQRNYYEHIIRNEDELNRIQEYIINNPLQWAEDENNPENLKGLGDDL